MSVNESEVVPCEISSYDLVFERAEQNFQHRKFELAQSDYNSCILLANTKYAISRCNLRVIECELLQNDHIPTPDLYVARLDAYAKSGNNFIELERLKLLVLLSEKSLLKIDMLSIRSRIFKYQPWPRNANPYARCLLDSGAPQKAIELLLKFETANMPKYVAINRLSLLAACYDMLDDIDQSLHSLQQIITLSDTPPVWVKSKINDLQILNGSCTEYGSSSSSAIYHRIEEGDNSVISELGSDEANLSDEQVAPYIAAVAALRGTPSAISTAESLFFNTELTQLVRCRALNFLIPYASNSLVQAIEIPPFYEFLELALIKYQDRNDFITWMKKCSGGPGGSKKKIIQRILASEKYSGGLKSCSFNGESSIYRKQEGADKLLIIFCGLHGDLFWKPESLSYLLEDNGFSVLWLNDRSGNNFLTGLESYGKNGFEVAASLSSFIRKNGYKDVVCMGASAGGSAAAFAGFALQAKKIVALSPATFIKRDDPAPAMKIANKFIPHLTTKNFSLKEIFSNPNAPLLEIYYGEKSKPDCVYAQHMTDVECVRFYPIKGWRHHAITDRLINTGEFERIVDNLFV